MSKTLKERIVDVLNPKISIDPRGKTKDTMERMQKVFVDDLADEIIRAIYDED
jgi:hypothetical protein